MEDEETTVARELQEALAEGATIPVQRIRAWMGSSSPGVRSTAFGLLFEGRRGVERPPLPEVESFQRAYLEDCLRGAISGPDVHDPHSAAHSVRAWLQRLWRERSSTGRRSSKSAAPTTSSSARLAALRDWLARIYREGDTTTRDAIVTGALEHLFADREMAAFFAGWKADPVLATAYDEAINLSSGAR